MHLVMVPKAERLDVELRIWLITRMVPVEVVRPAANRAGFQLNFAGLDCFLQGSMRFEIFRILALPFPSRCRHFSGFPSLFGSDRLIFAASVVSLAGSCFVVRE
jgi:hypothetical protein